MPNVVITRNTYPDDRALNRVIYYALDKAIAVGSYGVSANAEAAYMQMQFVKRAFYQSDALQLKHFMISLDHTEAAYIDDNELLHLGFLTGQLFREYQMVYGIHMDGSHEHLHIIMNTTSFLDGHQYITISALAEQTGKTERSIRYNLNLIDEFLHRKKLPYLSREFARGVRLVHTPQIDKVLQSFLSTSTPYQYKFSTEEREKVLKICLLVGRRQYIPIADLSEWLTVSYGTITADLDNVEKWLAKQNLSLIRRSRMGIQVKGSEQLILRSCLQLLGENITLAEFDRYLCQKPLDNKITLLILNELFAGLDIDFFRDLPKQAEGVLNCMFSDESFGGLTFYLALLAQRHISGVAGIVAVQDKDTSLMKSDEQKAAMLLETLGECSCTVKYHKKIMSN